MKGVKTKRLMISISCEPICTIIGFPEHMLNLDTKKLVKQRCSFLDEQILTTLPFGQISNSLDSKGTIQLNHNIIKTKRSRPLKAMLDCPYLCKKWGAKSHIGIEGTLTYSGAIT